MYTSSMALSAYRGDAKARSLHLIEITDTVSAAILRAETKLRDPLIQARIASMGNEIVEACAFDIALEVCRYLSARGAMASYDRDVKLPIWLSETDQYIGRFIIEYGSLISIAEETIKLEWKQMQPTVMSEFVVTARSGYRKWLKVYVERLAGNSLPMRLQLHGPIGKMLESEHPSGKEFRQPSFLGKIGGKRGEWVAVPMSYALSMILRAFETKSGSTASVVAAELVAQEQGSPFDEDLDSMKVKTAGKEEVKTALKVN